MNTQDFRRKLTAVFSADVAGYSRLMGEDEAATVRTLEAYKQVLFSLIKQHRGRVVDSPGDNLLAEFASVVDAVQCGVAVQKELQARNAGLPQDRKMQFRIGINLGDVIEEGDRIYGDGVNIAARLEALAEPGGICISKTAFDHIESKLPLGYQFLGQQTVKNMVKPIGAYKVLMESRVIDGEQKEETKTGQSDRPAPLLPEKPSIAVLPFVNMSDDPKQDFFSDGLTEEIITALSKTPKLFVIARNSSFVYKGQAVNVRQVSRDLGVKYVLEGSVRKSGNQVRITAQLIDAMTGNHLWAERYDREMKDIFALQDEITMKVIEALQVELTEGEQAHLYGKGTQNLEAYLLSLQAQEEITRMNKDGLVRSRQMVQKAIALDPNYARLYHLLASSHANEVPLGLTREPKQSIEKAVELEHKALALDDSLSSGHGLLGWLYVVQGEHDKGITECEQAVRLEPNSAQAHFFLSLVFRYSGRAKESIAMCKEAIRLDPIPVSIYYQSLANAYCLMGRYEEAITAGKKAVDLGPDNMIARAFLAVAYSLSGKEEEASIEANEVMRLNPKFSVAEWEKTMPYKNKADKELIIAALHKAGLQ